MKIPFSKQKRQKGLLYVERNRFTFHNVGFGQKFISWDIEDGVINDMEIDNPEKFVSGLAFWMDKEKISPCDLVVVVDESLYFEHATQSLANSDQDEKDIETFLQAVPFEQFTSKIIQDGASKRVVALNRDFYDLLLEFLEKRYFRVLALIPASFINIKSLQDIKTDLIIKNLEEYKKYNFLGDFERKIGPQSFISKNVPKDTRNLKIMSVLFLVLILILVVMVYLNIIRK